MSTLIAGLQTRKISPLELALIDAPAATVSHKPVRHADFALLVEQGLQRRGIRIIHQEYAVSPDGLNMFGMMTTSEELGGCKYAIGLRNSNKKEFRLGLVSGVRITVCENLAFMGEFSPLSAMHTSGLNLEKEISWAVDQIHANIDGTGNIVKLLRNRIITDTTAKLLIYDAFTRKNSMPKQILGDVHKNYFEPSVAEFEPRTAYSIHNAFTSSFKKLAPVRQFQETAKLTPFIRRTLELN